MSIVPFIPNVIGALEGFSYGALINQSANNSDTVSHGGNHLLAAPHNYVLIIQVSNIAFRVLEVVAGFSGFFPSMLKTVTHIALLPLYGFIHYTMVSMKFGSYNTIIGMLDQWRYRERFCLLRMLPQTASLRTQKIAAFLVTHTTKIVKIAALIFLGVLNCYQDFGFVLATTLMMGLSCMEKRGCFPGKVNTLMEKHLPNIGLFFLMVIPVNLITKIFSIIALSFQIPKVAKWFAEQTDALMRKTFLPQLSGVNSLGYSLGDIRAPVQRPKELTGEEMLKITRQNQRQFYKDWEINPRRCQSWSLNIDNLPVDNDLESFLTLFDRVFPNNQTTYNLFINRLKNEVPASINTNFFQQKSRFSEFLEKSFPDERQVTQDRVEPLLQRLAVRNNLTLQNYVYGYIRGKLQTAIDILTQKRRGVGFASKLDTAINLAKKVLPFIKLQGRIDQQDFLLKAAVEMGDYCHAAFSRCMEEAFYERVVPHYTNQQIEQNPILAKTELQANQALQQMRLTIIQRSYEGATSRILPASIRHDVHAFQGLGPYFTTGIIPMINRAEFTFNDLIVFQLMQFFPRPLMYTIYQSMLEDDLKERLMRPIEIYVTEKINLIRSEPLKRQILENLFYPTEQEEKKIDNLQQQIQNHIQNNPPPGNVEEFAERLRACGNNRDRINGTLTAETIRSISLNLDDRELFLNCISTIRDLVSKGAGLQEKTIRLFAAMTGIVREKIPNIDEL